MTRLAKCYLTQCYDETRVFDECNEQLPLNSEYETDNDQINYENKNASRVEKGIIDTLDQCSSICHSGISRPLQDAEFCFAPQKGTYSMHAP